MPLEVFPQFMLELGEPLGWTPEFKDNLQKQKEFLKKMDINTYFDYTKYSFVDVLENLFML